MYENIKKEVAGRNPLSLCGIVFFFSEIVPCSSVCTLLYSLPQPGFLQALVASHTKRGTDRHQTSDRQTHRVGYRVAPQLKSANFQNSQFQMSVKCPGCDTAPGDLIILTIALVVALLQVT